MWGGEDWKPGERVRVCTVLTLVSFFRRDGLTSGWSWRGLEGGVETR